MLKKVRDFVKKFNNDGFTYQNPELRTSNLVLDKLADAVHEFEIVEDKHSDYIITKADYTNRFEELNKMIDLVYTRELLIDKTILKQLKDCEDKRKTLEEKVKEYESMIDKLRTDRDTYKGKFELYDQHFKGMYGSGQTQTGDTSDE